ncbi:MAG TPA: hypothetical protein VLB09_04160, partial [Nitrospiria bacterium]|nr:hypothetical protein [Nitrospiria bacterium]
MLANDKRWGTKNSNGQPMKARKRDKCSAVRSEAGFLVGFLAVASTVLFAGFLVLIGFLALAIAANAGTGNLPEAAKGIPAALPLPDSLNAFYPPAADRPVYLFRMLGLETSFSGIVVDLMEEDLEGARGSFEDFQKQYREIASMVPEWSKEYPEKPLQDLGAALASGDKRLAMNAFGAVGEICHRCHVATMVPVQQKYHWGDFRAITVKDPLSGEPTGYPQFKKYLASNLAGMTVNLRQGQTGNAR